MQAAFARVDITPAVGTPLMGWGDPLKRPATSIHDPLYLRLCWLRDEDRDALIMAVDWCFVSRRDTDRFKTVLAGRFGLRPDQILLSASHTHAGPVVGTYLDADTDEDPYIWHVEQALVDGAEEARKRLVPAHVHATTTRTSIPMNRRRRVDGTVQNRPNPEGQTYDTVPICLVRDEEERPIVLLFAASTHPVCMQSGAVCADYPGVAAEALDRHLGTVCAMFLQGTGGDSRPVALADTDGWVVNPGWTHTTAVGEQLAEEVIGGLDALQPVKPAIRSALIDTRWPLQPAPDREALQQIAGGSHDLRARWARSILAQLDRGSLCDHAPVALQGICVGDNLRLIALEGEPMAAQGMAIEDAFPPRSATGEPDGATFALGYANGEGLYLATSPMLEEGGYESISYWEFGFPAPLAPGNEQVLQEGLATLRRMGIR